ncbi:Proposed peptidoglycan lipid II flippase MurJ [hydrothermal vent metagenome]|uniref:Proposed peptidoglycan lipid II flippase MurJ n=1 Tax=hydrothermal vent metagenome TaxID=652676 RepID=A0A3B1D0V3_9ZZZZ
MSIYKSHANHSNSHRTLLRSISILSIGTLSSRILGFFRDVILAKFLGTGLKADAFFVAFKIPNLFRDFVGEGATNAAVIPILTEYQSKQDKANFWRLVNVVLVWALMLLSALTLCGMFLTPVIVRMIAPGFIVTPEKLQLTIALTKGMFPYLVFIGLTAYSFGILHTLRSFVVPAFTPCLLNIAIIISALVSWHRNIEPIFGVAVGVLIGGVLQLMFQVPALYKAGVRYQRPKSLYHPGAARIGKLLLPRMIGSGVYQLTVLIDTLCASLSMVVGQGGISAIYFATRLIQFPMGIFGVSVASAALPSLSALAGKKDMKAFKEMVFFSLRNVSIVMGASTGILFFLAEPIVRLLFERGVFSAYSTQITSGALRFYALGLCSFAGIKILVTAFHALQDTKTPVKSAAICLGINAVLNIILMFPLKLVGIALASSISATINFTILLCLLNKKLKAYH